jgi:hypothetical protein
VARFLDYVESSAALFGRNGRVGGLQSRPTAWMLAVSADVRESEMRRNTRWRIPAILLSTVLASVALVGGAAAEGLSPQQQFARDIYQELVEINTVTATGDTARAAEAMAARLRAAGFPEADVHAFSPAPRKGNLVARLRGSGARKPILLLAHIDVVPANREDWSVDPFKLIEKDGYYTRGSDDSTWRRPSSPT